MNLLSVACEELLLHYVSWHGYLRLAHIDCCEVSHDEVISIGGALGKGGSPYNLLA